MDTLKYMSINTFKILYLTSVLITWDMLSFHINIQKPNIKEVRID